MKTEEELRGRVRELVKIELRRRLEGANTRLPHLCSHNYRHALDTRKTVLGEPNDGYNRIGDVRHLPLSQTMGLCMLGAEDPEQWKGDICDEPIDAQRCPYFTPREGEREIMDGFTANLKDTAWVEEHMPAVAALLWVAGDTELSHEPDERPIEPEPKETTPEPSVSEVALIVARPPWWKRLWRWLF